MISILIWCYSRQQHLDQTLPRWLEQTGTAFEVILGHGPDIRWPADPRIIPVPTTNKMAAAYNTMLSAARGSLLLLTQADMLASTDDVLKRMAYRWKPGMMVLDVHYRQLELGGLWHEQNGFFSLQLLLLAKQDVITAGGWWPGWDDPRVCAHEDGDLTCRLLERGLVYQFMETPLERGVHHIYHDRPLYHMERTKRGKPNPYYKRAQAGQFVFWKRHNREIIRQLVEAQFVKLRLQREIGMTGRTTPAPAALSFDPGMIVRP